MAVLVQNPSFVARTNISEMQKVIRPHSDTSYSLIPLWAILNEGVRIIIIPQKSIIFACQTKELMAEKRINKKSQVIEELFKICKKKNNFEFHNDIVKQVCVKVGFGNPFDVTKLDSKAK